MFRRKIEIEVFVCDVCGYHCTSDALFLLYGKCPNCGDSDFGLNLLDSSYVDNAIDQLLLLTT